VVNKENKKYISTTELAKILGISRVAVFNKIKSGEISAEKIGRNYAVPIGNLQEIAKTVLNRKEKQEINEAVKRIVEEYGETLRLLGKE
jgi:excisionase family DNA binding protein